MKKKTLIAVTSCLAAFLSMPIHVNADDAPSALVSADWSVHGAHNLASNPPSLDAVQNFYDHTAGHDCFNCVHVCEFHFANLRTSGNLSLVVSVEPGNWGCTELDIFDKTPTGFELYSSNLGDAPVGHDLANSVLDLGDKGRNELVLWGGLARFATSSTLRYGLGCDAEWPLIFAWTGNAYSDVSNQYKGYYQGYLKSVSARLAAYSSVLAPAAAPTANPAPKLGGAVEQEARGALSSNACGEGGLNIPVQVAPAPTPEGAIPAWAARNEAHRNFPCTEIEAAKTEAFLGIHSGSTMSAAIKDSESDDPNKRITAAVIFSYLGTQEAEQDLKTLSNDTDSKVAALAKRAPSFREDPPRDALTMSQKIPMSN